MHRRPTIVLLALLGVDYALWLWAVGAGDGTASLLTGLLLVPLGIAVVWRLLSGALGAIARAPRRRPSRPRARTQAADALSSDASAPARAARTGEAATVPPSRIAA